LSRHFEYANEQITYHFWLCARVVRDSSAVRRLFVRLAGAVGQLQQVEQKAIGRQRNLGLMQELLERIGLRGKFTMRKFK
jgi:hypothetical protein